MKSGIIVLGHDNDRPVEGPAHSLCVLDQTYPPAQVFELTRPGLVSSIFYMGILGPFFALPHPWQQSLRLIAGLPDSAMIAEWIGKGPCSSLRSLNPGDSD
jgi:hypothetical protein